MNPHLRSPLKLTGRLLRFFPILTTGRSRVGPKTYRIRPFALNRVAVTTTDHDHDWLHDLYRELLSRRQGAFVDVGANTGQTMVAVLEIDPDRRYVGFEPQPSCAHFLDGFISRNRLSTHTIMPVGLSDETGMKRMLLSSLRVDPTASLIDGFRPASFYREERWVSVIQGDDAIGELDLSEIAVVKVDVEGGELEVLRGMRATLDEHHPYVVFEVLNHFLAATGSALDPETIAFREGRLAEMEALLRERAYDIYHLVGVGRLERIEKIVPPVSGDLRLTNYLAVPEEEREAFAAMG